MTPASRAGTPSSAASSDYGAAHRRPLDSADGSRPASGDREVDDDDDDDDDDKDAQERAAAELAKQLKAAEDAEMEANIAAIDVEDRPATLAERYEDALRLLFVEERIQKAEETKADDEHRASFGVDGGDDAPPAPDDDEDPQSPPRSRAASRGARRVRTSSRNSRGKRWTMTQPPPLICRVAAAASASLSKSNACIPSHFHL